MERDELSLKQFRVSAPAVLSTRIEKPPPPPMPSAIPFPPITDSNINFKTFRDLIAVEGPKITSSELMVAKKNLRSTNRKFIPVTLDRQEVFASHGIFDHLPLVHVKELLLAQALTSDVVSLNLSGTEQLTDCFFYVLKYCNVHFHSLKKLNCSGCHYLTDTGIFWASQIFKGLHEIELKGCKNLTECSLNYLLNSEQAFVSMSMMGTSVGMVPTEYGSCSASLNLLGCPLVSPPLALHKAKARQAFSEDNCKLLPLNTYKAIILQDGGLPSLGERLVNKSAKPAKPTPCVWLNQKLDPTSAATYNIFEIPDGSSLTDMFLSGSSIIFLPYSLSGESIQLARDLAAKVISVLSKCPESLYVLVGMSDSDEDQSNNEQNVRLAVVKELNQWTEELAASLKKNKGRKWQMAEIHFHKQEVWAAGERSFQQMEEIIQDTPSRLTSWSFPGNMSPDEEQNMVGKMMSGILLTMTQMFCNNYHHQYFPHLHKIIASMETDAFPLKTLKNIVQASPVIEDTLDCRETYSCTGKVMEIMHRVGKCLYFPFIDEAPTVVDVKSWLSFLDRLFMESAPQEATLKCFGVNVPCWTQDDLRKLLGPESSSESLKLHLAMLLKHGCLLKLPRDSSCDITTDGFLFVLVKDFPASPAVPLEHFWPVDLPDGEKQGDKYYTFMAGLPVSFFPNLLRQCGKICRFTSLWQTGAFIQQGPVDILVEKLQDAKGFVVIVICGRVQKPQGEVLHHTNYENCLWAAVNTFCGVLQYLLQKYRLYASTTVPCRTCAPSHNRHSILQSEKCFHFMEHLIKGGHDRGFHCKVENNPNNVVNLRETLGPEMPFSSLVPRHDKEFQKIHNLIRSDSYTRCFQCRNCAAEGIHCEENGKNGLTRQHCSCTLYVTVCTFCGICRWCAKYLAKLNGVLYPCFDLPVTHFGGEVSVIGDIVNFKQAGTEIQIIQPMTVDYFPCLSLIFLRGSMLNMSIKIGSKRLHYSTGEGKISFSEETTENKHFYCKDGDNISLHLFHSKVDLGEKTFQIKLNGYEVFSTITQSDECEVTSIKAFNPSGIVLYAPGCMSLPENELLDKNGTVRKMCTRLMPAGLEAKIGRMRSAVEDALFQIGGVDFNGTAAVLLPDKMTDVDLKFPSRQSLRNLICHPLCYTRFNISDMMTIQPTYPSYGSSSKYWLLHMVDAVGYSLEKEIVGSSQKLLWAWTCLLAFYPEIQLPRYDQLLPEVTNLCTQAQIAAGIQELLHLQTCQMFLNMPDFFGEADFEDIGLALIDGTKGLQNALHSNIEQSGLVASRSMFVQEKILFLCSGHTASWQLDQDLTEIPREIYGTYSYFLKSVHMQSNNLTSLPAEMFTALPCLLDIDVSHNYLEEIPDSISKCTQLYSISVTDNNLTDLPMSLAELTGIGRVDISNNMMDYLPPVLTKLTGLLRLSASNLMLTQLPEDFGNLEELERLYLNGNCLTKLPASFASLKNLLELNMNGVPWYKPRPNALLSREHFEEFLHSRGMSRWLDEHVEDRVELFRNFDEDANGTLDSKEIGKLNATIFTIFPRFGYKGSEPPDEDTQSGFPAELLQLQSLDYLSMQYQAIVHIPAAIEGLSSLRSINLGNNPHLLSIPAEAGNLPLTRLELEECALLKTPPKEIREKGFSTTFAYLRRLLTGSVVCKRTKLMLVGLGGAGKTSLVRSLLSGSHKINLPSDEDITDGIDISTWTVKSEDEHISYSVWDFAGQTVYYNTHQFFLSNRAVYLLLWNVRLGHEHAGLNFWLSSICVHAPKAPIFVVGTHIDQVSKIEIPWNEMQQRYHQIVGFHFVSSFTGKGMSELQDQLLTITRQQQYMGEHIPGVWLTFENHIIRYRETADVIEYSEVEKKGNISGIFDKTEIYQAVQFLNDLGSLQHFTNDFLKSKVVINPQWIVDVMACVVSVKDSPIQEGRLLHSDIKKVWSAYPEKLHSWLLRLTEEFDLTFPLHNEKVNLVPCLLPEKQPDFVWPELDRNSTNKEAKMIYKFDYLPAGLFNRGQVRLHQFSESSLIWKRGSFLKKNSHIALIRQIRDSELIVKVQGPRPDNILFLVHEVFEGLIIESFQGVTYDLLIPCPDCMNQNLKDPHMFAASTIRRAVELKAPFLQCLKYFHTISIVDLLAVMPPDCHSDYDIHLVQAVRGLKDLHKDMVADVFISYCSKDAPENDQAVIHPASIHKDLEKVGYKCWFDEQRSHTIDELARALMDSSVFVALVSNQYVQDETCCNIFKYARLTLRKPVMIVVVGEGMEWKQSKLGLLLADEVFVNMTNSKLPSYKIKLDELLKFVKDKIQRGVSSPVIYPKCFISYSWINSATAVSQGTRVVPGALGPGDPRQIKQYLQQKGIECWIDIERVGVNGLFEDIAEGLLNAKILIACVSDEYANSPNCQLEFRYAANVLKLPIVLAVVGTGNNWRATEVGILSLGYPLVSLQEKSDTAHEKLYQIVHNKLQSFKEGDEVEKTIISNEQQRNLSFQEVYELAQRKFLRQITNYAETQDMDPYPRLFLADFIKDVDKENETEEENDGEKSEEGLGRHPGKLNTKRVSELFKGFKSKPFCAYILCEHEEGWHSCSNPIPLPQEVWNASFEKFSPYLARITAIMKYSKHQLLYCMGEEEGQQYMKWLEECPQATVSDFQQIYHELRQEIIALDNNKLMGQLARCHLPNGKTTWLCEKHRSQMRVTVLSSEVITTSHKSAENITVTAMLQELRRPANQLLASKFNSSRKSKRRHKDKKKKFNSVVQKSNQTMSGLNHAPQEKTSYQMKLLQSSASSSHKQIVSSSNEYSDEINGQDKPQPPSSANHNDLDKDLPPPSANRKGLDKGQEEHSSDMADNKISRNTIVVSEITDSTVAFNNTVQKDIDEERKPPKQRDISIPRTLSVSQPKIVREKSRACSVM